MNEGLGQHIDRELVKMRDKLTSVGFTHMQIAVLIEVILQSIHLQEYIKEAEADE